MSRVRRIVVLITQLGLACSSPAASPDERAEGERLVSSPALSPAALNFVACTSCHPTGLEPKTDRIYPGAPLAGALSRPSFWGGQVDDALYAVNACRSYFMYADVPWTREDPQARAVYVYLADLDRKAPPSLRQAQPFTPVTIIETVARGDASRGASTYKHACLPCHGQVSTGDGRPSTRPARLPDETIAGHNYLLRSGGFDAVRLVFIEKIRHGGFYGYGGSMPPFSKEALPDGDVADILAYLKLDH